MSRIPWLLFANLVALCLVVAIVVAMGESPGACGYPHPEFPAMFRGGNGAARHGPILALGWLYGALQISFVVGCLAWGAGPRALQGVLSKLLWIGGLALVGVYTAVFLAYQSYMQDPMSHFIGPFPAPTAIMLFGMWWVPLYFVVLYVAGFRRWFLTPESLAEFRRLVAARQHDVESRH